MPSIELLSPAANLESGKAAIDCGADAVYIGAPKYGARSAAGNSLEDIASLIQYAHLFRVKVYITLNTLLHDREIPDAVAMIKKLYEAGADGIIIQDLALLECDLPPIPLIASTQMHNLEPERIYFLDQFGFSRIILARELPLQTIRKLKDTVKAELEYFVHGALCVGYSGQCYLSYASGGRSANRGECAQPCRLPYSLTDLDGKVIVQNKHLLSIKDLNLSERLGDLLDAGVTSFKIEGRLKDIGYVKNITAFYRQKLDEILVNRRDMQRASSGRSEIPFTPDPERSFNRGFTQYNIDDKVNNLGSIETPKSKGKALGFVRNVKGGILIQTAETLRTGDGLCYLNFAGELEGFSINKLDGEKVILPRNLNIPDGTMIYRNSDLAFEKQLQLPVQRKICVKITLQQTTEGIQAEATDEDGISAFCMLPAAENLANDQIKFAQTLRKQFAKSGNTPFEIENLTIEGTDLPFLTIAQINEARRRLLEKLTENRLKTYIRQDRKPILPENRTFSIKNDFRLNVINEKSQAFYEKQGITIMEAAPEKSGDTAEKVLMTCKYCIRGELGLCLLEKPGPYTPELLLIGDEKKYRLIFDCGKCEMSVMDSRS
jgi:23S rRNA 5-hydroxycytidine C2501 synthase